MRVFRIIGLSSSLTSLMEEVMAIEITVKTSTEEEAMVEVDSKTWAAAVGNTRVELEAALLILITPRTIFTTVVVALILATRTTVALNVNILALVS
jgi:hypothetical protein